MDFQHFDHVTRAVSSVGTRRRALGLAATLPVLGALLTLPDAEDVLGRRRRPRRKHRHDKRKHPGSHKHKGCKPKSKATVCAGKCGPVKNKQTCGKTVDCGPCDCVPTTCAAQGKTCGTISDGCGSTLACGSCSNPTPACRDNVCVACSQDTECGDGKVCCGGSCVAGRTNQTTFGSSGSGADQFSSPYGVAVLADGLTSLVADTGNGRIKIWTRPEAASTSWSYLTAFGNVSGPTQFYAPEDIAVSTDGLTAWVADAGRHRISVWTRPNATSTEWSSQTSFGTQGSDPNQFSHPTSVAVSSDGLTAWVADSSNNRVGVWTRPDANSTDWVNQVTFGSQGAGADQFEYPCGVAVSPDSRTVWVADTGNYRVSIWTRPDATSTAWTNQTTFGSEGTGASQFFSPFGLAISPDALTLWVADTDNHRVAIWSRPDASSMTWSNQTLFGERGSGAGQLDTPFGVALLPGGQSVLVVDGNNDRISVWGQSCPE